MRANGCAGSCQAELSAAIAWIWGMHGCATYEWQSHVSSRSEQPGFSPEEGTPQLFSLAEWIKVLSQSTRKSSFPTFQFCSESCTCILWRSRALGHCISHGGTSCALAPSLQYMFHFHPGSGWHQESVQLRRPLVMWPVANVCRSLKVKVNL